MSKIRTTLFSTLVLVLLLSTSIVYASEGTTDIGSASQAHCNFASSAYAGSGEFSAEPLIESATLESLEESATLAICLESLALSGSSGGFSGDDAYDVAAISAAEVDLVEVNASRTWEIDAEDFAAAREAAGPLSQSYTAAEIAKSSNPELSVAQFNTDVAPVSSDANAAFLAANPEVRYIGQVGVTIGSETKDCYADCYDNY